MRTLIENMEDNSWLHSQTCQALLEQTPTSYIELRALHYAPAMVVSYLPGLLKFIPQSMRQVCFMCSLGCLYYKKLLQLYPDLATRDKLRSPFLNFVPFLILFCATCLC